MACRSFGRARRAARRAGAPWADSRAPARAPPRWRWPPDSCAIAFAERRELHHGERPFTRSVRSSFSTRFTRRPYRRCPPRTGTARNLEHRVVALVGARRERPGLERDPADGGDLETGDRAGRWSARARWAEHREEPARRVDPSTAATSANRDHPSRRTATRSLAQERRWCCSSSPSRSSSDTAGNRNILNGNLLGGNTQPEELRDPGAEGIHEQAGEHQDADRRDRGQGEPSPAPSLDGDGCFRGR
jgi:hypothetical protein